MSRSAEELMGIFKKARDGVVQNTMAVRRAYSRMDLGPPVAASSVPFQIYCLSPTGRQAELYEQAIFDCIGPDGKTPRNLTRSRHNDISVVLRVAYGDTIVILGGDLERAGWVEVMRDLSANGLLQASAVKVSHHGSENGYCDGLGEHFAAVAKPIALIAPQERFRLPKPAALTHIGGHARAIYSTCPPQIDWVSPRVASGTGPPLESRIAIRETFSAIPAAGDPRCGRCSLRFNDRGDVDIELRDPAVALTR